VRDLRAAGIRKKFKPAPYIRGEAGWEKLRETDRNLVIAPSKIVSMKRRAEKYRSAKNHSLRKTINPLLNRFQRRGDEIRYRQTDLKTRPAPFRDWDSKPSKEKSRQFLAIGRRGGGKDSPSTRRIAAGGIGVFLTGGQGKRIERD